MLIHVSMTYYFIELTNIENINKYHKVQKYYSMQENPMVILYCIVNVQYSTIGRTWSLPECA